MSKQKPDSFMRQFAQARKEMQRMAMLHPYWFGRNGKPTIATLTFPKVPRT